MSTCTHLGTALALRRGLVGIIALLAPVAALGDDEDPAPVLTPIPERVAGVDQPAQSLSGAWQFAPAPPKGFAAPAVNDTKWDQIEVPGEWAIQGFSVAKNTAAGYRRRFSVPSDWSSGRVKLRCDAVYSDAVVWINGQRAGHHMGGFTAFELDVTSLVQPGKENLIALAVKRESLTNDKFTTFGSAYAAHPLGGISRKLTLFAVPRLNVRSLHVATTFDDDYCNATLKIMLSIANQTGRAALSSQVRLTLTDPQKRPVPFTPAVFKLPAIKAGETLKHIIQVPVATPATWDAEHPRLYVLRCQLETNGQLLQVTSRRFGFRQVQVRGNQLFVNNRPVKLRGACRHEAYAIRGRSLTPELWRQDAELFRDANVNFIRTSHYPPAEEFIDACDELGIFVEAEAPFHHAELILDPDYRRATLQHTAEMLERDRSHPSVIIWSVANETKWSPNFEASAALIRKVDPTRPRIFSNYWGKVARGTLDIVSEHYPGPGGPARFANGDRPVLFDEYCHLYCYNREEMVTDPGLRDSWGVGFANMWEKMLDSQGCLGGALWGGVDEVFLMPAGEVGWGAWGLIDCWKRTKPEYWHAKKVYSPVRVLQKEVPLPAPGGPIRLDVANRHDFTDLRELRVEWSIGDESGTASTQAPPRSTGELTIRPKRADLAGRQLSLRFHSPRGFLVDAYHLPIGKPLPLAEARPKIGTAGKLDLRTTEETITVTGKRSRWILDRKTGMVRQVQLDRRIVLVGGPVLMVLPLKNGKCAQTHSARIPPFNETCGQWQAATVQAEQTDDGVRIRVEGTYEEATGSYVLRISHAEQLTVEYHFLCQRKINPRQIGIVFDLPKTFDTLSWRRRAQWSVYPPDHIGRPAGQAKAFRGAEWPKTAYRQPPPWPWALDSNALGTNDFRATRTGILRASLQDAKGYGIQVRSDGRQSTRAYVEGERVRLLVAGFSTGGDDRFFGKHLTAERRPLVKGSALQDRVQIELCRPQQPSRNR